MSPFHYLSMKIYNSQCSLVVSYVNFLIFLVFKTSFQDIALELTKYI